MNDDERVEGQEEQEVEVVEAEVVEETGTDVVPLNLEPRPEGFGNVPTTTERVHIETGRGQTAEAQVGQPFTETIERVADQANYGGYFRVFLNGEEVLEPTQAPEFIEPGQRIAITSYDKVG